MKRRLLLLLIAILTILSLDSCSSLIDNYCNGVRYQIRVKTSLNNSMCHFRAESVGSCLTWDDQKYIEFTDSCKVYGLSEVVDRDKLFKKYGI